MKNLNSDINKVKENNRYLLRKRKGKYLVLKDPELNEIADKMRCGTPVHIDEAFRGLDAIEQAKKN